MIYEFVTQTSTMILELGFPGPEDFVEVQSYADEIWAYAWNEGVVPYASAAIAFRLLVWFLVAAKGE